MVFKFVIFLIRNFIKHLNATPLHYAVLNQLEKVVQLLLNHSKIDPNIKDNNFEFY